MAEAKAKAEELATTEARRLKHFQHGDYEKFVDAVASPVLAKKSDEAERATIAEGEGDSREPHADS